MLESIRKFTKSPPAVALLCLLIISFGAWGISGSLSLSTEPPVARVGDQTITAAELQRELEQRVNYIRESGQEKTFDLEQARALGLDKRVFQELVQTRAYDQAAHDLGVGVPEAFIIKMMEDNPDLQTGGKFDRTKLQDLLRNNNMSEDHFVALMRSYYSHQVLLSAVRGGIVSPKAVAGPLIAFQLERRTVRYFILPPEQAGTVQPVTDDDIAKYYAAHQSEFMAPEYRRITFVDIDPAKIAKATAVPEGEIAKRFDERRADYAAPEKRRLDRLVYQDKAKAQAVIDALKSGKSFADILKAEKKTQADVDFGDKMKVSLPPELAGPVFAAPEGGAIGPIEGELGYSVVHVAKVTPASQKTLADMHDQIASDIAKEKASKEAYDRGNKLEDARNGQPLEAAAKAAGLEAVTIESVNHEGVDAKGNVVSALADKPQILDEAFKGNTQREPQIQQTAEGSFFVVRIDGVTPPAQRPLTAVQAEIRKGLEDQNLATALLARAKAIVERGTKGEAIESLGTSVGLAPREKAALRRDSTDEIVSAAGMAQIFNAPRGGFITAPVGKGSGLLIAQITSLQPASEAEITQLYEGERQREMAGAQDAYLKPGAEIGAEYGQALVARYKVKINQEAYKRALGGV